MQIGHIGRGDRIHARFCTTYVLNIGIRFGDMHMESRNRPADTVLQW